MFADKKILVVDDSQFFRTIIRKNLNKAGYTDIDIANDGPAAIEMLKTARYDLVCSDYDMPGMNGGERLKHIRQNYPGTMVIILSAQAEKKVVVELMRSADNYVIKDEMDPDLNELELILERTFEKQRLKTENERLLSELQEKDRSIQSELILARSLLKDIVQQRPVATEAFRIEVYNQPSNIIGGDFYRVKRLGPNHIAVMLADISGHGIPAALLLFVFNYLSENVIKIELPPHKALYLLNTLVEKLFPQGMYATVSYMILAEKEGEAAFTNTFQNPIVCITASGDAEFLNNSELKMLGILKKDESAYQLSTVALNRGDRLYLFTDGLTEAKNPANGEMFGVAGVADVLRQNRSKTLCDSIAELVAAAEKYSGHRISDDITVIGMEKI